MLVYPRVSRNRQDHKCSQELRLGSLPRWAQRELSCEPSWYDWRWSMTFSLYIYMYYICIIHILWSFVIQTYVFFCQLTDLLWGSSKVPVVPVVPVSVSTAAESKVGCLQVPWWKNGENRKSEFKDVRKKTWIYENCQKETGKSQVLHLEISQQSGNCCFLSKVQEIKHTNLCFTPQKRILGSIFAILEALSHQHSFEESVMRRFRGTTWSETMNVASVAFWMSTLQRPRAQVA